MIATDSPRSPKHINTDRNLIFGLLALQIAGKLGCPDLFQNS
jgi:hypothetical protein